jgi:hypothetical protein
MSDEGLNWRNESLGTRIRVALWLRDEVGEGGAFSKAEVREAIKGSEQVERRMRDLRPAGWVIKTYRDKPSLRPDQLYLESIGQPVWEPEHRAAGLRHISAKTRSFVYERDGHMCRRCGVSAAEEYADEPGTQARLTLGRVDPQKSGPAVNSEDLITECARCNGTAKRLGGVQMTKEQVWDRLSTLPRRCQRDLLEWMRADCRPLSEAERAWGLYRQLPATAQEDLQRDLENLMGS